MWGLTSYRAISGRVRRIAAEATIASFLVAAHELPLSLNEAPCPPPRFHGMAPLTSKRPLALRTSKAQGTRRAGDERAIKLLLLQSCKAIWRAMSREHRPKGQLGSRADVAREWSVVAALDSCVRRRMSDVGEGTMAAQDGCPPDGFSSKQGRSKWSTCSSPCGYSK